MSAQPLPPSLREAAREAGRREYVTAAGVCPETKGISFMTKRSKVFLALAVGWGLFIFANSLLPGGASTGLSDAVAERLPGGFLGLDWHGLTVLVRKSAHFLEYALLGGLAAAVFHSSAALRWKNVGNLLFPCLAWAVADEFLQTFVEGRTGLVRDVAIDFGGVLVGCCAVALLVRLWARHKLK